MNKDPCQLVHVHKVVVCTGTCCRILDRIKKPNVHVVAQGGGAVSVIILSKNLPTLFAMPGNVISNKKMDETITMLSFVQCGHTSLLAATHTALASNDARQSVSRHTQRSFQIVARPSPNARMQHFTISKKSRNNPINKKTTKPNIQNAHILIENKVISLHTLVVNNNISQCCAPQSFNNKLFNMRSNISLFIRATLFLLV